MSRGLVVAAESSSTEKKGMRLHVVVVCSAVGFLGFIILILGVAAEAATAKAFDLSVSVIKGKCVYRATPALPCGVIAALLVITSQVVVTATSLCCGCCRTWEVPTQARRIVGIVLSAVSWLTVIIVAALFIVGAAANADQETRADADGNCALDPGSTLFAAATVLSVAATGMQIASYILLQATTPAATSSTKPPLATQEPELSMAMAQPVVELEPQQNGDEVIAVGAEVPPPSAPVLPHATEPASQV